MCSHNSTRAQECGTVASNCSLFTLFQAAFDLPIVFSASVEGFVIEMKLTAPVPEDNAVSLKAKSCHSFCLAKIHESKIKKSLHCS